MIERVVISNDLVRAAYTLSLNEKRLVMFAVSKLSTAEPDDVLHISAIECARLYKMDRNSARRRLKKAMDSLWDRELILPNGDGLGRRWIITRGKYETGDCIFAFHPDLTPHLFNLKKHFTQYFLERAADFRLFYSWRIFEMLMQYRSTGYMTHTVKDFEKELELSEYYSKDFGRIRSKVIKPAIDEIKSKSGLDVKWKAIATKGRKIERLEFTFPVEPQTTISNLHQPPKKKPASKPQLTKEEITKREAAMDAAAKAAGDEQMKQLLQRVSTA